MSSPVLEQHEAGKAGALPAPAAEGKTLIERRTAGAKPLVFEFVEKRRENLRQAGVDLVQEAARAQETAALEELRAQVRAVPARVEAARAEAIAETRAVCEQETRDAIAVREREAVSGLCAQMQKSGKDTFNEVESGVVRLALSIAESSAAARSKDRSDAADGHGAAGPGAV